MGIQVLTGKKVVRESIGYKPEPSLLDPACILGMVKAQRGVKLSDISRWDFTFFEGLSRPPYREERPSRGIGGPRIFYLDGYGFGGC